MDVRSKPAESVVGGPGRNGSDAFNRTAFRLLVLGVVIPALSVRKSWRPTADIELVHVTEGALHERYWHVRDCYDLVGVTLGLHLIVQQGLVAPEGRCSGQRWQ